MLFSICKNQFEDSPECQVGVLDFRFVQVLPKKREKRKGKKSDTLDWGSPPMGYSSLFKGLSLSTSNADIVWYSVQYASNMDLLSLVVFSLNGV